MNVATQVAEELEALGLNEAPPENTGELTGVDKPAAGLPTSDREHQAKTAQALARAVDQLADSFGHLMDAFGEVRSSAHALVESLAPDAEREEDSEGDDDNDDAVSQGE